MDLVIQGHNLRITEGIREYAEAKISRLDRYLPNISEIRVDLSRQNTSRGDDLTIAQITLRHSRGAILRAEEKLRGKDRDSVQAAINLAVDKMYRQIERFKGKRRNSRKGRERYIATEEELGLAEEVPAGFTSDGGVPDTAEIDEIVRRKNIMVAPMSEEEAIEQMELLGHNFFMFYNLATNSVNVLYRRANGGYGVLVPELQ